MLVSRKRYNGLVEELRLTKEAYAALGEYCIEMESNYLKRLSNAGEGAVKMRERFLETLRSA